ncbi:SoxR reducing system RseC family protein [Uliginosibacterium sp. sgz301328]|uniref:SoxR reducing system RseC family protein n=1 Tax=Uliginosibacterium sp. sgz301328 TaxID=3243764 RepID=UPI00359DAD98
MQVEAVVTRIDARQAIVKVVKTDGGCGRCDEPGGCRSAMLGEVLGPRCGEYAVDNVLAAAPGARVTLEVPDSAPLRAAVLAYLVPLLLMLCGAAVGQWLTGSDAWAAVGAMVALALSLGILRRGRAHHSMQSFQPRMVRVLPKR